MTLIRFTGIERFGAPADGKRGFNEDRSDPRYDL